MIWDDSATWLDATLWDDTDGLDAVSNDSAALSKTKRLPADDPELIRSLVPVGNNGAGDLTADTELTDLILDRVFIDKILIVNTTANAAQLSAGTTSGGFELFTSQAIAASGGTMITIGKYIETACSLFLHDGGGGDTWNSSNLNLYVIYWKL